MSPRARRRPWLRLAALALLAPVSALSQQREPEEFPPAVVAGPADVPVPPPTAEPYGPKMDVPEFVLKGLGLHTEPTHEEREVEAKKRFHWNVVPFVLTNPLIEFGLGVAGAGVFRIGDTDTKLSKFSANVLFTVKNQVSIPLRTAIFFGGNDWSLVGYQVWNWFPSPTWGIGGNTPDSNQTIVDYGLVRLWETVYRRLYSNLYFGAGLYFDHYYSVGNRGGPPGQPNPFSTYPYGTSGSYNNVGISADLLLEGRDNPVNATRGYYASVTYRAFPTWMGSSTAWQYLYANGRAYFGLPLPHVLAFWAYGWFSFGNTPYLDLPAIGTDPDFRSGRGYITGRHVGKSLLYAEAEYRFRIWEFLGGAVGLNVHSVSQALALTDAPNTPRFQYWWPAATIGLRTLVNRPSRANALIEFGIGLGGSHGFYVNINENF